MLKKGSKIISTLLISMFVLTMAMMPVMATDYLDPDSIKAEDQAKVAPTFQNISGAILTVVQVVGIAVAVIMLIVLAIKYISAAPNDKAEIKKHAVVYVVGAIVLFAAAGILGIIQNFANVINVV